MNSTRVYDSRVGFNTCMTEKGNIMKKLFTLYFLLFTLFTSLLLAETIEVKQDGTGNFTTIQEGINASVNSDTVLVYPGTYYENVEIVNKSIVLASLEMITGDSTYIDSTIIDGNQSGSCVYAENVTNGTLQGFTIQNGSGNLSIYHSFYGGGILVEYSVISIISCNIINNTADIGGGSLFNYSTISLVNNNFTSNNSLQCGGGLCIGVEAFTTFDIENLNNIYLNTGGRANDIWLATTTNIILDKFTVDNPDIEFIGRYEATYTFSCHQAAIEQIPNDLYVSTDGNDENSGLTPEDPLKTIAYANLLIKADSLNPRTIQVADGLYSTNATGDHLPINLKSYVSIIGESEENTIIDGDEYYPIMAGWDGEREVVVKNFTFRNCKLAGYLWAPFTMMFTIIDSIWKRFTVTLENLTIKNTTPRTSDDTPNAIELVDGDSIIMKNITIEDNICGAGAHLWTMNLNAENLIVKNTQYISGSEHCSGSAMPILRNNTFFPDDNPVVIKNLLICDNEGVGDLFYPPLTFNVAYGSEVYVINGTFADNAIYGNGGGIIRVTDDSKLTLINSVVHNNEGIPVYLDGDDVEFTVDHCLFTNGYDDLYIVGEPTINWLDGNISGDPEFMGEGAEWPYNYLSSSPCIDAGTTILPDGIELPEYDLAGNPRIYGDTIDMGAFEWQGVGADNIQSSIFNIQLRNYPNPFNPSTTITFSLTAKDAKNAKIEIYNLKGQKVREFPIITPSPAHSLSVTWDGTDNYRKPVSSGVYLYRIKADDYVSKTKRMLLIK